ncbi:MAG: T9SS type A sorting domain-containing protein, partial [Chitinispirillales bacterium]|nr:T9SS type A sorting domain-containing protein [Chitinispirillales bacterium]
MCSKRSVFVKAALAVVSALVVGAFAQGADTARVPFVVNVNATVKAVPEAGTTALVQNVQTTVNANQSKELKIPLPTTSGVLNGAQSRLNAPAVISNRAGKVTLSLSAQSYGNAEISLYTVNGKRILYRAVASEAVKNISCGNLTAGAYLLSVKGTNGGAVTSRLTHNGGGLDIGVSSESHTAPQLAKKEADGKWKITVSASGYSDSSYTLVPVKGTMATQNITLRAAATIT